MVRGIAAFLPLNIPAPYVSWSIICLWEDAKAYIADFVRSPIASTFIPGSMSLCYRPIQVQVTV